MKKCKYCKTEIDNKVKRCPSCNKKQDNSTVISLCCLIAVFFLITILMPFDNSTNQTNTLTSATEQAQQSEINTIIEKCGLDKGEITRDELLDTGYGEGSIGYRIKKDGINAVMYLKDGKVLCIKYADKFLYNNGEYPDKLSNYIITEQEKSDLIYKCENVINSILKAPSTAKYPWSYDEWKMVKDNGEIVVQSYVDAENSFGAKMRSKFQFIIKNNKITSLIFDGKEYMK